VSEVRLNQGPQNQQVTEVMFFFMSFVSLWFDFVMRHLL